MRILHTADWHLGRIFHGVHLTEDQAYTLAGFGDLVDELKPDVVILAGDLYDRAVPPPEAVALLDDTLSRLVLSSKTSVLAIAGNHDSPERVGFGARLLESARFHVVGLPSLDEQAEVVVGDGHGSVRFHLLPFAEPGMVRRRLAALAAGEAGISAGVQMRVDGHGAALETMVGKASARARKLGGRHVVVAHGSVADAAGTESERPLFVGPHGAADARIFDAFAYTALGHHHHPQDLGSERVRYPGSLLTYSFAETGHRPSVTLIDIDAEGGLTREVHELPVRHQVEVRRGTLAELLEQEPSDAYLKVVLTDDGPVLEPLARLRERFPFALTLEQERLKLEPAPATAGPEMRELDDRTLFASFFAEMTGQELDEREKEAFGEILERAEQRLRIEERR